MPLLKQHSFGDWRNEEGTYARLNRKLLADGYTYETNTEVFVPDLKVGDEEPVGYTIYTFSSRNSYDIEKIMRVRPAFAEGEEEQRGYIEEIEIDERLYPYFVYLVPGKIIAWEQVPFTEYYKTEDQ